MRRRAVGTRAHCWKNGREEDVFCSAVNKLKRGRTEAFCTNDKEVKEEGAAVEVLDACLREGENSKKRCKPGGREVHAGEQDEENEGDGTGIEDAPGDDDGVGEGDRKECVKEEVAGGERGEDARADKCTMPNRDTPHPPRAVS